jgi:hypothetical protein
LACLQTGIPYHPESAEKRKMGLIKTKIYEKIVIKVK